jgi:hypothetical protein
MKLSLRYLPAALVVASVSLFGQSAPHLSPHTVEVGGFIGSSYGLDEFRVMGGGNVTYGINRYILPYAEFSYFPGIPREQRGTFPTTGESFRLQYSIPISDFHGGVHLRIPIRESRVVPYLVFGLGGLHTYGRTVTARYDVPVAGQQTAQIPIASSTDFATNYGGGLRYYTTQRFGMRLEAKVYKPTGSYTGAFGKIEWGFFFQFR